MSTLTINWKEKIWKLTSKDHGLTWTRKGCTLSCASKPVAAPAPWLVPDPVPREPYPFKTAAAIAKASASKACGTSLARCVPCRSGSGHGNDGEGECSYQWPDFNEPTKLEDCKFKPQTRDFHEKFSFELEDGDEDALHIAFDLLDTNHNDKLEVDKSFEDQLLMHGWLKKRAGLGKVQWKPRYVLLLHDRILYFKNDPGDRIQYRDEPRADVFRDDAYTAQHGKEIKFGSDSYVKNSKKKFGCFEVNGDYDGAQKTLYLVEHDEHVATSLIRSCVFASLAAFAAFAAACWSALLSAVASKANKAKQLEAALTPKRERWIEAIKVACILSNRAAAEHFKQRQDDGDGTTLFVDFRNYWKWNLAPDVVKRSSSNYTISRNSSAEQIYECMLCSTPSGRKSDFTGFR